MDFPDRPRSRETSVELPRGPAPPSGDPSNADLDAEIGEPEVEELSAAPTDEDGHPPAAAGPPRRRPSETLNRLLWAFPAIALAIFVVVAGGAVFAATMVAFSWIGLVELFRMTAAAKPFQLVAFAATAGMIIAAELGDSFQMVLAGVAFFPVLVASASRRESLRNITISIAVTIFAIIWIGLPFAHAVLLRGLPDHGAALVIDVLVATFVADTFAYLGGRAVGQRPLAPLISPNKTVEGLAIGILGGTLGFWIAGLYQDWLSGTDALLLGFCIALIAPLGDLFESMIKRDLDFKDSGAVFGPHGGMLDRLDAVMFTIVGAYYLSLAIVY